jgi:tripartite-type tricarboxylate transporter receptor subunit TctC
LIGLAVTGLDREVLLPNLPTVAESGLKGFDVRLWVGLFAPAGLPDDRMALMEKAVDRAMASEQMGKTLSAQGVAPFRMNRTEFSVFVDSEIERWRSLVSALSR